MCKWSIIYIHCTYCSHIQIFLMVHYYTHFLLWKMNNHFHICVQPRRHHYQVTVTSSQVTLDCWSLCCYLYYWCNVLMPLHHFHWILDLEKIVICNIASEWPKIEVMVLNTTFNNISVISQPSVLLVEETAVPGENHQPAVSHWQTWSHNVVSSTTRLSRYLNSQRLLVVANPTTIRLQPRRPPYIILQVSKYCLKASEQSFFSAVYY